MKRVLLIMALLISVVEIGLTTVLAWRRGESEPEAVVVRTTYDRYYRLNWVLADGDRGERWTMTPRYKGLGIQARSPDGEWLYLHEWAEFWQQMDVPFGELARVRVDGTGYQHFTGTLVGAEDFCTMQQDGWLYYRSATVSPNGSYKFDLYRVRDDGSALENLTEPFPDVEVGHCIPLVMSLAHDWVAFNGLDLTTGMGRVYRLDLPDATGRSALTALTNGSDGGYLRGDLQNSHEKWLLVMMREETYRMRWDGSDLTQMTYDGSNTYSPPVTWNEGHMFFTSGPMPNTLMAVSTEDFAVRWVIPKYEFRYASIQIEDGFTLAWCTDGLYRVWPDGTIVKLDYPMLDGIASWPLVLVQGDWVIYTKYKHPGEGSELVTYATRLSDGYTQEVLWGDIGAATILGWSDDYTSLIAYADNTHLLWRIWLNGERRRLVQLGDADYFVSMGHVPKTSFDPLILIGGGSLLIVGALIGLRQGGEGKL